ncbi:hypothetical protein KJ628_05970, partial [Patescibacteria group bacterium]|nr:hypothetical protein [Patescibacteria group bacterium]
DKHGMMSQQQIDLLKNLRTSQTWLALAALRDNMTINWQHSVSTTSTEWGYISESLKKDGRIEGVLAFLREIESLAGKQ